MSAVMEQAMTPAPDAPEPQQPSPLSQWLDDHHKLVADLREQAAAFQRHLEMIPRPMNEGDTRALMVWRKSMFLPAQETPRAALTAAAKSIAQPLHSAAAQVEIAASTALQNLDGGLAYLAANAEAGLLAPDTVPDACRQVDAQSGAIIVLTTHLESGALGRMFADDEVTIQGERKWCHLGRAIRAGDGRWILPRWITLSFARGLGFAARQQQLQDERDREQVSAALMRQAEARERATKSPTERIRELEKQLAKIEERS